MSEDDVSSDGEGRVSNDLGEGREDGVETRGAFVVRSREEGEGKVNLEDGYLEKVFEREEDVFQGGGDVAERDSKREATVDGVRRIPFCPASRDLIETSVDLGRLHNTLQDERDFLLSIGAEEERGGGSSKDEQVSCSLLGWKEGERRS